MGLGDLWIDVEGTCETLGDHYIPKNGYGYVQLIFLMMAYGYVLYEASNLISEGSELLMLVLNPGLIGGLVLPIMGAVPDGAMVLFSGLGDNAQTSLKVGVGTLAGSTIMLLTVPWFICAIVGRVDIVKGKCAYKQKPEKLTKGMDPKRTGTQGDSSIPLNAKIMIMTSISYVVIQGPSFYFNSKDSSDAGPHERWWAFAGLVLSFLSFIAYSVYQVFSANALEQQEKLLSAMRIRSFHDHVVDLAFLMEAEVSAKGAAKGDPEEALLGDKKEYHNVLRKTFRKYDEDNSDSIDVHELRAMFNDHGIRITKRQCQALFEEIDTSMDGQISFDEYCKATEKWVLARQSKSAPAVSAHDEVADAPHGTGSTLASMEMKVPEYPEVDDDEEDEEEEEEEEEEKVTMTPAQIKMKATVLLLVGVGLVTLFSDPMVDVLSTLGTRMGISPFYVSFIVTPLASNASELISSIIFAKRKTKQTITLTYSALLGAATMNNTFCLCIFLAIVFVKKLVWEFSAEVCSILLVEIIMVFVASKQLQPLYYGYIVIMLFPLSILFVWFLESPTIGIGWD
jgi:Ca2+/Na+ antiporter